MKCYVRSPDASYNSEDMYINNIDLKLIAVSAVSVPYSVLISSLSAPSGHLLMDWSWSSAFIHPLDTLGRHGWDIAQPNDPQDARPSTEPLPFNLSTDLHADYLDEALNSWPKLDSALVEFDDTECLTGGGTAHASLSLIGSERGYLIPHDAEYGLVLTDSSKPAAEPVEAQPKARYRGKSLERASCKRGKITLVYFVPFKAVTHHWSSLLTHLCYLRSCRKNALLCTWEGCKKPGPFSRKSVLVRHSRAHVDPSAFKCDHCAKRFNRKDNMNQHVQRVHANQV